MKYMLFMLWILGDGKSFEMNVPGFDTKADCELAAYVITLTRFPNPPPLPHEHSCKLENIQ